jgi:hypothetical protein
MARATIFFRTILGEFVDSDVTLEEFSRHFSRRGFDSEAFFVREGEANERIGFLEEGYMRMRDQTLGHPDIAEIEGAVRFAWALASQKHCRLNTDASTLADV